jgi:hypothetical protein
VHAATKDKSLIDPSDIFYNANYEGAQLYHIVANVTYAGKSTPFVSTKPNYQLSQLRLSSQQKA